MYDIVVQQDTNRIIAKGLLFSERVHGSPERRRDDTHGMESAMQTGHGTAVGRPAAWGLRVNNTRGGRYSRGSGRITGSSESGPHHFFERRQRVDEREAASKLSALRHAVSAGLLQDGGARVDGDHV